MCRGQGNFGRLPGVGKAIADKITTLCGPVHPAQTTTVFYALSQSGLSALQRGLVPYGIDTDEHAPVTYTLARNNETGDITVHYSEPEGFPIHFSWQTTIHLDGSSDSPPSPYRSPPTSPPAARAPPTPSSAASPPTPPSPSTPWSPATAPPPPPCAISSTPAPAPPPTPPPPRKPYPSPPASTPTLPRKWPYPSPPSPPATSSPARGPNAHVDVEKEHAQLKRDLAGGYRYHFPGGLPPTNDYNEIRNRFVRFLTRRNNITFAEADEAVKKRVAVLMTLATQYTSSLAINAVSTSMAQPGGNPLTYMLLMQGGTGVDLQFAKDPEGNIRLTVSSRTNAQMLVFNQDNGNNQEQHKLPAGSTYSYKLTITLPAENLDELAEADWAHYDRKAGTNFDGPIDARVNLIPPACRFKGTADLVFHLHEAPAPVPAP